MARIKFGMVVVAGRGKIGGQVLSAGRSGATVRTKTTPVNGKTVAQNNVRSRFTSLSQGWRDLTQAQRDAWNAAVAAFARTNVFGDIVNPSGSNLFQRLNNNLLNIGESSISDPPIPVGVESPVLVSVTNAIGAGTMTLVLDGDVPAATACIVFATAPMSAGKSFVKSEYRQIAVLAAEDATPVNIKAAYIAKFGSQGSVGQKIFFMIRPVNIDTGLTGGDTSAYVIASA